MTQAGDRLIRAAKEAVKVAKCPRGPHGLVARASHKYRCPECGAKVHTPPLSLTFRPK